jgi:hypothetical protein
LRSFPLKFFERCYIHQNMSTLETDAISAYIQNKDIKHIPVVGTVHDIDAKIRFMSKNELYLSLYNELIMMEAQFGFPFLNSAECESIFDRISTMEQTFLEERDDDMLYQICNRCDMEIDRYENEIINNIYQYSRMNSYDRAILLLGAAHRKSVLNKIDRLIGQQELILYWNTFNVEKLGK